MGASLIVTGTIVASGMTVLNQLLNGSITMRPVIGGFIVGTSLLILALFNPQIASALALLLLVSSLLNNAAPVLAKVINYS
jgi:hypothetical protein